MNPDLYCRQKVAAKDPGFSFSLRKLTAEQRAAVTAVQAFYLEIDEVIFACQEPAVAFAKLNWWRLEVTKLMEGHVVDHPVILALQRAQRYRLFATQRLLDMIDSVAQNLNLAPFPTFEDITLHILHTAGVRELLIAEMVQREGAIPVETIYQFTLVLQLAEYLQHLRRYVRRGLIVFGEDELRKFGVSLSMLRAYQTTPQIKNLLQYQFDKAEVAFQKATAELPLEFRKVHANLVIRSQVALTLLREIRSDDFKALENLISLTPLRCWWVAVRFR